MRWAVTDTECDGSFTWMEFTAERRPARARVLLNDQDSLRRGTVFETLASVWDLAKRRRYQSMWYSMIRFLLYCAEDGALEDVRLRIQDMDEDEYEFHEDEWDGEDDLLDIMDAAMTANLQRAIKHSTEELDYTWDCIRKVFVDAIDRPGRSTARNNPLLWWMGINVKSAISSGPDDYITRGRFQKNPLPMDLDLRERAAGLTHYATINMFHSALGSVTLAVGSRIWGRPQSC